MKNSVILIIGFCIFEVYGNISYKAKFIGNLKVAGDSQLVYALSVTHCLAQCNKDANCDAITFFDELKKCRLFSRCTPMQIQNASSHYWFFAKRPPISSEGYMYEENSDSCIKLSETETEYNQAEENCYQDNRAYLANLNSPEFVSFASKLLRMKNRKDAWVSMPSDLEKYSTNNRKTSREEIVQHKTDYGQKQTCRVLLSNQVMTEITSCRSQKKFSVCQIPTY